MKVCAICKQSDDLKCPGWKAGCEQSRLFLQRPKWDAVKQMVSGNRRGRHRNGQIVA